jgi:hypothetical protein
MELIPLTEEELTSIRKRYNYNYQKFKRNMVVSSILGLAALFMSGGSLWLKLGVYKRGVDGAPDPTGNLITELGALTAISWVLGVLLIIAAISYFMFLHAFRMDLKEKVKTRNVYEVSHVKLLSESYAKLLDGDDAVLHFKNTDKVKQVFFNQEKQPEFLRAKRMLVERAKYSYTHFKEELLE